MEPSVARSLAHYHLVFLVPDPETEERICVGLLFDEGERRRTLVFDRTLARLRCLAPSFERGLVEFYLESLEASVQDGVSVEEAAARFGPYLAVSRGRRVVAPITDAVKVGLLGRFTATTKPADKLVAETSAEVRQAATHAIADFVSRAANPFNLQVYANIRPDILLGRKTQASMKPVAAAFRGRAHVVLLDGVDLNAAASAKRAITQANHAVHKFWQYKRLKEESILSSDLLSVGVVINGEPRKGSRREQRDFREAHDYAVEQLAQETDVIVDTGSQEGRDKLADLLSAEASATGGIS